MPNPNVLLEGNLGSISLPNLLQLIALEQKDACLTLHRVEIGQSAEMVFRQGHLMSARVNQIDGNNAMFRILGWWNAGSFKLTDYSWDDDEDYIEPNITARMDYLLLEGMRQMDACQGYRQMVPNLTSAVSFTQSALDSFRWDAAETPEWIPHFVRQLPRSFTMAQLHQMVDWDELRIANLMKMLLGTMAVRVHTTESLDYDDTGFSEPAKSTRYEAFAQLLMEYVGYEAAYGMVDNAIYELGWEDMDSASFSQLIDLADRLVMGLNQHVDRKKAQDAMRRLRARATSLIG